MLPLTLFPLLYHLNFRFVYIHRMFSRLRHVTERDFCYHCIMIGSTKLVITVLGYEMLSTKQLDKMKRNVRL